jgi:hypothetical protein
MKLFYCDEFVLPLPPGHRFPMEKYRLLRERLQASGEFLDDDFQTLPNWRARMRRIMCCVWSRAS